MEHLVTLGFVFLNLFMIVGSVDLFYYHIWKYKLHTRLANVQRQTEQVPIVRN